MYSGGRRERLSVGESSGIVMPPRRQESLIESLAYSAVVRSAGHSPLVDELLLSLMQQSLTPAEIVIVLSHGTAPWHPPHSRLVRFVHASGGMVAGRETGIRVAQRRYLLLLDDDIAFRSAKAVEILFATMLRCAAQCAIPHHPDSYPRGMRQILCALFGMAVPTGDCRLGYTPGGGFYYPRRFSPEQPYEVEGGPGRCIAVDRDFLMRHQVLGDLDLERVAYALRDDGAFVLDVVRHGGKAILVGNVPYTHLGVVRKLSPQRLHQFYEASVFNNWVFWRKYIKGRYPSRAVPALSFGWLLMGVLVFAVASSVRHATVSPLRGATSGFVKMVQACRRGEPP